MSKIFFPPVSTSLLTWLILSAGLSAATVAADSPPAHQAMGAKVGEVTDTSAIVWTRLTAAPERNNQGVPAPDKKEAKKAKKKAAAVDVPADQLEGACPGAPGRMRVRYGTGADLSKAQATPWADVTEADDFTHQFRLTGLRPATVYHYATETTGPGGTPVHGVLHGKFETAPLPGVPSNVHFCVMTCQGYPDRGDPRGHNIYPSMLALHPQFVVFTGDNVYYDNDAPSATTPRLARYHWERMFSLPRQVELLRSVTSYFEKDDHDTLANDCWPGKTYGEMTFAEGQRIFRQQVPMGESTYRTFRWGRDVQIWLTEGRDFRSSNKMPDGPEKTIWGKEQKDWLKRTLAQSDATWKLLISPTPLVGPDRGNKNDNHSNAGFQHEGDEIRAWFQAHVPENFFVVCGDRHWQYHSVHPKTGLNEFSVGAASDEHAGGTPGEDKTYHRFHRVKGGFLSVTLQREAAQSTITFRHHDVQGAVVYQWQKQRLAPAANP